MQQVPEYDEGDRPGATSRHRCAAALIGAPGDTSLEPCRVMKWQYGRSDSAHQSCPICGGTGFVGDEPIAMPQTDFTTGYGTGSKYGRPTDFQPDEPIVMPQTDRGADAGFHRDRFGRWVQEPTSTSATDDPPSDSRGGFHRDPLGRWVQDLRSY